MLRIKTDVKIRSKLHLKCRAHPRFNPERDGEGGIKAGCSTCAALLIAYQARQNLLAAAEEYARKSSPFETVRPRARKAHAAEGAR